jgi:hypothetical protein
MIILFKTAKRQRRCHQHANVKQSNQIQWYQDNGQDKHAFAAATAASIMMECRRHAGCSCCSCKSIAVDPHGHETNQQTNHYMTCESSFWHSQWSLSDAFQNQHDLFVFSDAVVVFVVVIVGCADPKVAVVVVVVSNDVAADVGAILIIVLVMVSGLAIIGTTRAVQ